MHCVLYVEDWGKEPDVAHQTALASSWLEGTGGHELRLDMCYNKNLLYSPQSCMCRIHAGKKVFVVCMQDKTQQAKAQELTV